VLQEESSSDHHLTTSPPDIRRCTPGGPTFRRTQNWLVKPGVAGSLVVQATVCSDADPHGCGLSSPSVLSDASILDSIPYLSQEDFRT
jgi:hypothetical protein